MKLTEEEKERLSEESSKKYIKIYNTILDALRGEKVDYAKEMLTQIVNNLDSRSTVDKL